MRGKGRRQAVGHAAEALGIEIDRLHRVGALRAGAAVDRRVGAGSRLLRRHAADFLPPVLPAAEIPLTLPAAPAAAALDGSGATVGEPWLPIVSTPMTGSSARRLTMGPLPEQARWDHTRSGRQIGGFDAVGFWRLDRTI